MKKALPGNRAVYPRIFAAVLTFLLAVNLFPPLEAYSAGPSKAALEMEVKAGFDGVARLGAYTPYRITLINKGRAVEGELQVEVKIDSENKTVIAKPFSLPEASSKEITINAPVFTARRSVKIRAVENNRVLSETDYTFTRLIPSDYKTIGVLSSDNPAYAYLNGIRIQELTNDAYEEKVKVMMAAGVYSSSALALPARENVSKEVEGIVVPLDAEKMPDDLKVLEGFDVLILSNFDTSSLTGAQTDALEKWVETGGTLILGMGVNWKKVYDPLPGALKKFKVTSTESAAPPKELSDFAGTGFSGDIRMDVVTGDLGFEYAEVKEETAADAGAAAIDGKEAVQTPLTELHKNDVLIGNGEKPIAVKYVHKEGRILLLAFDPGMEPAAGWKGGQAFWERLLSHSTSNYRFLEQGAGYYTSTYNSGYNTMSLTGQVPEDKKPPFLFMFITIAVYIAVVGPFMYIFLKKKDRRDLNWLAVPGAALLCLLLIYLVGFRTRYSTAVLNTSSVIYLDTVNQKADVTTGMGIFNNKRGDLKLTYSKDSNIDFNITETANRVYSTYPNGREPEGKVVSKLVLSEPVNYELYDVAMWEPRNVQARKSVPLNGSLIQSVQIKDGKFKAVIKNVTQYELIDAFISVGSNFISVGDILPGEEKPVEAGFDSESVYKSFELYLDAKYGRLNSRINTKPPADYAERLRKRNAAGLLLENLYNGIRGETRIGFYALNFQDMGYELAINDKKPQTFNTNTVFSSEEIKFEKGGEVELPSGIILPELVQEQRADVTARMDGDAGLRVMNEGDIDFEFNLPADIRIREFSLGFDTYLPLSIRYMIEDLKQIGNNAGTKILQNQYEYFIYNRASGAWETIQDRYEQQENAESYIDEKNVMKVRVRVVKLADEKAEANYGSSNFETERLAFPELQIKGVAR
jgi:hypothetical protein